MRFVKNYFLLLLKSTVTIVFIAFACTSCKKDKDDVATSSSSIVGTYTGMYGFGNDTPDNDQKYKIKSGGVFQEIGLNSGSVIGEGTWQLNGTTLTAAYTMNFSPYNKYSISATFNESTGKLIGTWGGENNPSDGGKIDMTKQ